jgi:hypothetical protein
MGARLVTLKAKHLFKNIRYFDNNNVVRATCAVSLLAAIVLLAEPTQVHIALVLIGTAVLVGVVVEFSYRLAEQSCQLQGRHLVASYRKE